MTILHLLPGSSGFEEALPNSQPNWLCLSSCCPSIPAPVSHTQTSLVYFFNKKVFSHGPQWTSVESMGYGSQQRSRPAPRTHTIGACRNTSTEGLWFFFSVNSLTPHLILASPMTVSHGRGAWYKSHSLLVPSMNTAMLTEKHNSSMWFDQVIATR